MRLPSALEVSACTACASSSGASGAPRASACARREANAVERCDNANSTARPASTYIWRMEQGRGGCGWNIGVVRVIEVTTVIRDDVSQPKRNKSYIQWEISLGFVGS